jgi:Xaa-Pro aminopeptidase
MADQSERINAPISARELERRWAAVRGAMEAQGIDVLVMQNNNDFTGGYVKYFTDLPATNGYPVTVIFPRDDGMTVIGQGPFGLDRELPREGDGLRRGVRRAMGTPSFAPVSYTRTYDAELAAKALTPFARATVGLVGTSSIPYAFVESLKQGALASATLVEASDLVDRIKAIKSDEEIEMMRRTAAMQDAAMEAAFATAEPGRRDLDVAAAAEYTGHRLGSEQGLFLCASSPIGMPVMSGNRHTQNRILCKGDQMALLVENNGAGGFYTELGRTCVLGRASQEMKDEFAFVLEARKFTLNLLKPGASCKEIWEAYNRFMREHGKPEEARVYCHGQGYDMVERPLVRFDETMSIQKNIVVALHPSYMTERTHNWICDDYLIGENGVAERLHKFPEKIVELG